MAVLMLFSHKNVKHRGAKNIGNNKHCLLGEAHKVDTHKGKAITS
jgi:hypothetical protein